MKQDHPDLSVRRQCSLLSLARSGLYYQPRGESVKNLTGIVKFVRGGTLNLLHRLVDGAPINQPDVTPPSRLVLTKEPEANVARYDGLRTSGGKRHAS